MANPFLDQLAQQFGFGAPPMAAPGAGGPTPVVQQQQGMSPMQIQSLRDYVRALQKSGTGQIQGAVSSKQAPLAALGAAGGSLVEGLLANQADRAEANARMQGAQLPPLPGSSAPPMGPGGTADASPTGGAQSADLSYGSKEVPIELAKAGISGNEQDSRGYGTIGPTVPARGGHPEGHALGKYQVMNYDLPNRLAAAGLPPMNEAEFLRSPQAQEKQFEHEFGNLQKKYGNFNDAASVWFSGRPMAAAGNASDAGPGYAGTTVPKYVAKANQTMAKLLANQPQGVPPGMPEGALAFNGSNTPTGTPSAAPTLTRGPPPSQGPQPMLSALQRPTGPTAVVPNSGADSMARAVAGPGAPSAPQTAPEAIDQALGYKDGMPIVARPQSQVTPGFISEAGRVPEFMIPQRPAIDKAKAEAIMANPYADPAIKKQWMDTYMAQFQPITVDHKYGKYIINPRNHAEQRFEAAPLTDEMKGPGGSTITRHLEYDPVNKRFNQVGVGSASGGASSSSADPQNMGDLLKQDTQHQTDVAFAKETAEGRAKQYEDRRKTIMKRANDVQNEIPQLTLLKKVIDDPNFKSGFLTGDMSKLDQLGKGVGLTSGKMAETYQLAKKLGAAGSLANIRMMGEIGAVRIPEMQMVEKSNYDPENLPEVNKAVVEMQLRAAQREKEVAAEARSYLKTHQSLDEGFEQHMADYGDKHPMFSDKEIEDFNRLMERPKVAPEAQTTTAASTGLTEGKVAINPKTGERLVVKQGKLVPYVTQPSGQLVPMSQ